MGKLYILFNKKIFFSKEKLNLIKELFSLLIILLFKIKFLKSNIIKIIIDESKKNK
jgi:hypothetical protein